MMDKVIMNMDMDIMMDKDTMDKDKDIMKKDKDIKQVIDYKIYKVKPYSNSEKQPFGLTIKGKSKQF